MPLRKSPLLAAVAVSMLVPVSPASAAWRFPSRTVTSPVTTAVTPVVVPVTTAVTSTATAAAAVTTAAVSEMNTACTEPTSFKAFAAFGDQADYSFAPGGSFESGATGWSLGNASVVSGNENLGIFPGAKSLLIKDGGRVVSPWFCVTADHPTFRYATFGGEIEMEIDYKVVGDSDIDDDLVGETNGGSKWAPSSIHPLATEIPASKLSRGVVARLIFEAEDDVYVDDVLVDPYRRG